MTAQYSKAALECPELVGILEARFGGEILKLEVRERRGGSANAVQSRDLWIEIPRASFRPFLEELFKHDFVNFHVISGDDVEDSVVLYYHLSLFQRTRGGRIGVTLVLKVPKSDLIMPSIYDLLPGSEYSERETREMFGVDFEGLPNKALVFLPEDWNEEIKPWRRDATGPKPEDIRELA